MKFGLIEIKEFAENHEDERVRIMYRRLCEARSKSAKWCEEVEKLKKFDLKSLCKQYDKEYGSYPESYFEGEAIYQFFCEKNNLECDTNHWLSDELPHGWDI